MSQDTEHRRDAHRWISYDAQSKLKLTGMAEGKSACQNKRNTVCSIL